MSNVRFKALVWVCLGIFAAAAFAAAVFWRENSSLTSRARLKELLLVLKRDYGTTFPTNSVLVNYAAQGRVRSYNVYYRLQMSEGEWRSLWDQIVQKSGAIMEYNLTEPAGIDLVWWKAAPNAKVFFEKLNRSSPPGTVMLYLVQEDKRYYILVERME